VEKLIAYSSIKISPVKEQLKEDARFHGGYEGEFLPGPEAERETVA
jgi:hypothetical protein